MYKNLVKEKLLKGEKVVGTFFELGSTSVVECIGLAGYDYLIVDNEHGPYNPQTSLEYFRVANLYNTAPFARVADKSRADVLKLLDTGAVGLIIPNINTVEEVKKVIEYGKYMPIGNRGVANAAGTGYWYEDYASHGLESYFDYVNEQVMILPQCETIGCLEKIDEILALDGVDGIYVGPFDLSAAMGIPGQLDKAEFKEAINKILNACKEAGKYSFIFASTKDKAREYLELGFDSVTLAMDANIFIDALKDTKEYVLK